MPDRLRAAFSWAYRDERGMALPFALGVTVVLSMLAVGIFAYTTSNQSAAERSRADAKAYDLADAGLSYAFSTLMNASDPYSATAVPSTTVSLNGGSVTYSGSLSGATWTLTSTSSVANPSGPHASPITRTVSSQAQVNTNTIADMSPWDYLFIDQPSGCITLGNSVTMDLSLYVRGDLCLENNAQISSPTVNLTGNLYTNSPQASIGTVSTPISSFKSSGTCYYSGTPVTCGPAANVYAGSTGTDPPIVSKPSIDLAGWYANSTNEQAYIGPARNCNHGGFPGGFDNNSVLDVSLGDVDITPASAYDCWYDANGDNIPEAQIKWDPGLGQLTIKGVIYFDGNLTWSNLNLITYDGKGVIYASGQIVIRNRADMCGVPACDSTWDPTTDLLVLIAGSLISTTTTDPVSGEIGNHVNFQGAIYTVTDFSMDNNTTIWGPVITRSASIANSALLNAPPQPIQWMTGIPANTTTQTTVSRVQGSYSG